MSAALAWILAAALAVGLAALAGYLVAARIARPVVALTEASDRMAAGDLGARAPVAGGDEVGRLGESFNGMAARVESTVTSLRRFVADAAHEIGTPLTALQADLELAERKATSADERRLVGRALGQTAAPREPLEQPAAAFAPRGGRARRRARSADLAAVARELADGVASRAEQAGIELELRHRRVAARRRRSSARACRRCSPTCSTTRSSSRRRAAPCRSRCAADGAVAVATVADTGVGIPADEQAEIFGRFHRARNVSAYPGNGLGLAIVKAAVERGGGTVSFTSSQAGTTFRVSLPLI